MCSSLVESLATAPVKQPLYKAYFLVYGRVGISPCDVPFFKFVQITIREFIKRHMLVKLPKIAQYGKERNKYRVNKQLAQAALGH